jgi:hypothetical protein
MNDPAAKSYGVSEYGIQESEARIQNKKQLGGVLFEVKVYTPQVSTLKDRA